MRLAIQGILLFLFIPLVLFLYLRQPMGPAVSIVAGVAIMLGHRFVAAPWMARHSTERCLWCGRAVARTGDTAEPFTRVKMAGAAPGGSSVSRAEVRRSPFTVFSGGRPRPMMACSAPHRDASGRFLTFIERRRLPIAIGIFLPLLLLLAGTLAFAAGRPFLAPAWNTWQFKTIVALTVVVTSLASQAISRVSEPLRSPFPLHNFFLLGIRNTLWVFRVVGAWWLIAGCIQLMER